MAQCWDVAVIGTGMGGATAGWALAQHGLSVVFLEKGAQIDAPSDIETASEAHARLAQGWWPNPINRRLGDGTFERSFAPLGCAVGGSTIHYAAALERLAPSDFESLDTAHGRIPAWPAGYQDFLPFYGQAEALYRVDASTDRAFERLSVWDRELIKVLRANGCDPELLRVAMRYDEGCEECLGRICPRDCKADARSACLKQALSSPKCTLLDRCDVQVLDANAHRVRTIRARRDDRDIEIEARIVVLSAGALHSPQLLLRSANELWPNGLANRSDMVGRNLMFHTSDILALWSPRRLDRRGRQKKSLSIRDFYRWNGDRLGYVQSMGLEAGRGSIAQYLKDSLRRRGLRNELLLKMLAKIPSHIASYALGGASLFAAMSEDDPDPDNRIFLEPRMRDGTFFTYMIADDLRRRAHALREEFKRHVKPWRLACLSGSLSMNYGHPCGTLRFGENPEWSVLDRNCRSHDVENLYVLDSSFMPRSGAVNPSLTIAANALRVSTHIAKKVKNHLT